MKTFDFKIVYGYLNWKDKLYWIRLHRWHWGIGIKRTFSGWKGWLARPPQKLSGMAIKWEEEKMGEIFTPSSIEIISRPIITKHGYFTEYWFLPTMKGTHPFSEITIVPLLELDAGEIRYTQQSPNRFVISDKKDGGEDCNFTIEFTTPCSPLFSSQGGRTKKTE